MGKVSCIEYHVSKGSNCSGRWEIAVAIVYSLKTPLGGIQLRWGLKFTNTLGQLDRSSKVQEAHKFVIAS